MKLVYQIPNKLYYIQNFLDYPAYKQIHYDVFRSKRIKLNSVEGIWDDVLFRGAAVLPDKANLIDSYEPLKKFKILLETNPFCPIKEKINQFMHHSLKDGASINWHADAGYEHGITYYINRRWNSKFGGELLFKDDTANGFIPVVGNSLVILKSPFMHKVGTVLKPTVPRKTLQVFTGFSWDHYYKDKIIDKLERCSSET